MQWYIVRYKDFSYYGEANKSLRYFGVAGDVWPITGFDYYKNELIEVINCYKNVEKNMEYIELEDNYFIHVITDLDIVRNYSELLQKKSKKETIILNVSNELNIDCDGFDFGNPEGGYSIITTNILNDKLLEKKYLNSFGLFNSIQSFRECIKEIKINTTEDLDDYYLLSIRIIE